MQRRALGGTGSSHERVIKTVVSMTQGRCGGLAPRSRGGHSRGCAPPLRRIADECGRSPDQEGETSDIGLFEAIYNCRSIRYLKPDPVPDALVKRVLDAAIRAPNGSNRQTWHFVVVKDAAIKRQIQQ